MKRVFLTPPVILIVSESFIGHDQVGRHQALVFGETGRDRAIALIRIIAFMSEQGLLF